MKGTQAVSQAVLGHSFRTAPNHLGSSDVYRVPARDKEFLGFSAPTGERGAAPVRQRTPGSTDGFVFALNCSKVGLGDGTVAVQGELGRAQKRREPRTPQAIRGPR